MREVWELDVPDRAWMERFLEAVGSNPKELPPELLDAAVPLVPVMRRGRLPSGGDLPLAELAAATYPKLVISGGHDPGFEAAVKIDASVHRPRAHRAMQCRFGRCSDRLCLELIPSGGIDDAHAFLSGVRQFRDEGPAAGWGVGPSSPGWAVRHHSSIGRVGRGAHGDSS
jgi:hypothetical protein